jgi:hypothetical protein
VNSHLGHHQKSALVSRRRWVQLDPCLRSGWAQTPGCPGGAASGSPVERRGCST